MIDRKRATTRYMIQDLRDPNRNTFYAPVHHDDDWWEIVSEPATLDLESQRIRVVHRDSKQEASAVVTLADLMRAPPANPGRHAAIDCMERIWSRWWAT